MDKDEALQMCLEYIETDAHERKYVRHAIKQALAAQQEHEPKNEPYVSLASVQEPVLKPLSKKWKWVLHESFADVAGFDEEGIPSFYWKESVTKFKSGELSAPCKGKNCGSMNGWLHSVECRAEHEAQYTTPPAAQQEHEPENEPFVSLASVQEPVAWGVFEGGNLHDMFFTKEEADNMAHLKGLHAEIRPLTTPPAAQRQWVGLSQNELDAMFSNTIKGKKLVNWVARAIEAKLKEKNT